jgi:hypothetical protein
VQTEKMAYEKAPFMPNLIGLNITVEDAIAPAQALLCKLTPPS